METLKARSSSKDNSPNTLDFQLTSCCIMSPKIRVSQVTYVVDQELSVSLLDVASALDSATNDSLNAI
jgi:hypothetical protein